MAEIGFDLLRDPQTQLYFVVQLVQVVDTNTSKRQTSSTDNDSRKETRLVSGKKNVHYRINDRRTQDHHYSKCRYLY